MAIEEKLITENVRILKMVISKINQFQDIVLEVKTNYSKIDEKLNTIIELLDSQNDNENITSIKKNIKETKILTDETKEKLFNTSKNKKSIAAVLSENKNGAASIFDLNVSELDQRQANTLSNILESLNRK